MYYLLLMCHVYMKVWRKFLASECLLPCFLKLTHSLVDGYQYFGILPTHQTMKLHNPELLMEVGQRRNTQNKTVQEEADLFHNVYKLWVRKKHWHNTEYCLYIIYTVHFSNQLITVMNTVFGLDKWVVNTLKKFDYEDLLYTHLYSQYILLNYCCKTIIIIFFKTALTQFYKIIKYWYNKI